MTWLEDGEYEPTPLMQLADEAGLTYWELWNYLEGEVERRLERVAESSESA